MEDQTKRNTENEDLESTQGKQHPDKDNITARRTDAGNGDPENEDIDDTDKYLALEQPGVSYTNENDPTINSDQSDFGTESRKREWNDEGGNSKNSDAFNQDDYILEDNLDLDEDQSQSISSDDEDFEETNERY